MEKIVIDDMEWTAPEYKNKEHSNDWFWAIGLISIIGAFVAIWFKNYIFAIFILLSGSSLVMFSIRQPKDLTFSISKNGISAGRDFFKWGDIKSFNIKNDDNGSFSKLLIETKKHFLPIYTLPFPKEYKDQIKENMLKLVSPSDIKESQTVILAEKIGF